MNDTLIGQDACVPVTALELAQIRTLLLLNGRHRRTVSKLLASRGVSELEELDGLSLKNLLHYLLSP